MQGLHLEVGLLRRFQEILSRTGQEIPADQHRKQDDPSGDKDMLLLALDHLGDLILSRHEVDAAGGVAENMHRRAKGCGKRGEVRLQQLEVRLPTHPVVADALNLLNRHVEALPEKTGSSDDLGAIAKKIELGEGGLAVLAPVGAYRTLDLSDEFFQLRLNDALVDLDGLVGLPGKGQLQLLGLCEPEVEAFLDRPGDLVTRMWNRPDPEPVSVHQDEVSVRGSNIENDRRLIQGQIVNRVIQDSKVTDGD